MAKDNNNFDPGVGNFKLQLKALIAKDPKIGEAFQENQAAFYEKIDELLYQMISEKVDEIVNNLPSDKQLEEKLVQDQKEDLEISGQLPETDTSLEDASSLLKAASKFEKILKTKT